MAINHVQYINCGPDVVPKMLNNNFITDFAMLSICEELILIGLESCFRSSFLILWVAFDTIQSLNCLPYQF